MTSGIESWRILPLPLTSATAAWAPLGGKKILTNQWGRLPSRLLKTAVGSYTVTRVYSGPRTMPKVVAGGGRARMGVSAWRHCAIRRIATGAADLVALASRCAGPREEKRPRSERGDRGLRWNSQTCSRVPGVQRFDRGELQLANAPIGELQKAAMRVGAGVLRA